MQDNRTLEECRIPANAVVRILLRLHGGAKKGRPANWQRRAAFEAARAARGLPPQTSDGINTGKKNKNALGKERGRKGCRLRAMKGKEETMTQGRIPS